MSRKQRTRQPQNGPSCPRTLPHCDSMPYIVVLPCRRLFALSALDGSTLAVLTIRSARNCDWEDITLGPGPGGETFIFIGDVGGNARKSVVLKTQVANEANSLPRCIFASPSIVSSWLKTTSAQSRCLPGRFSHFPMLLPHQPYRACTWEASWCNTPRFHLCGVQLSACSRIC